MHRIHIVPRRMLLRSSERYEYGAPLELSEDQFLNRFLMFIEENRWSFGGGVRTIVDGYYINEDGTPGKPVWPEEDE